MGVYVFRTETLLELLKLNGSTCNDFGSEIIPSAVNGHNVQVKEDILTAILFENPRMIIKIISSGLLVTNFMFLFIFAFLGIFVQ